MNKKWILRGFIPIRRYSSALGNLTNQVTKIKSLTIDSALQNMLKEYHQKFRSIRKSNTTPFWIFEKKGNDSNSFFERYYEQYINKKMGKGSYQDIVTKRAKIAKKDAPVHVYCEFLKELYPVNGNNVDHYALYSKYMQLPSPRLTYIQNADLEKFLSEFFMNQRGKIKGKGLSVMSKILRDVQACHVPLSSKEINMFITTRYFDEEFTLKDYETLSRSYGNYLQVDSYNIMIRFSIKYRNYELVEQLLEEMAAKGLNPDRITYGLLFKYYSVKNDKNRVEFLLSQMINDGIVMDINLVNQLIGAYIRMNMIKEAETLFNFLVECSSRLRHLGGEVTHLNTDISRRQYRKKAKLLDYITKELKAGGSSVNDSPFLFYLNPTEDTALQFFKLYRSWIEEMNYQAAIAPINDIYNMFDYQMKVIEENKIPLSNKLLVELLLCYLNVAQSEVYCNWTFGTFRRVLSLIIDSKKKSLKLEQHIDQNFIKLVDLMDLILQVLEAFGTLSVEKERSHQLKIKKVAQGLNYGRWEDIKVLTMIEKESLDILDNLLRKSSKLVPQEGD
ncbi:BA75_02047T0 [Komagataella pastoris]|uniref:Mitochondrial 15S rRNA processing factor CCM1 n=1 Tax=Komagataella pastoris TaxID=4922 RepID=A0A1B2JCG6_PICPA|nr:BA75_02047T0 [Komagataella pastoris]